MNADIKIGYILLPPAETNKSGNLYVSTTVQIQEVTGQEMNAMSDVQLKFSAIFSTFSNFDHKVPSYMREPLKRISNESTNLYSLSDII